ncbi:hypothetical protein [Kribbella deserti]|uniref:Uncharacterized protein n=1 Tax=Kribbella deserti TaxID=1926257 RepID=A0ABV6QHG0_9ACTN
MAFGIRKREAEYSNDPAVTLPIYLKFVQKHLAKGGQVNYSSASFASANLEYQRGGTVRRDESRRTVIAGKGTTIEQPNLGYRPPDPGSYYDDEPTPRQSNTTVYAMDGYKAIGGDQPTVYADVEFDAILTDHQSIERRDHLWNDYVAQGYGDLVPARLGGTAPDTYALAQNGPTPAAPAELMQDETVLPETAEAKGETTPPSGRTTDPETLRAFQAAFGNPSAPTSPTAGATPPSATTPADRPTTHQTPTRGIERD